MKKSKVLVLLLVLAMCVGLLAGCGGNGGGSGKTLVAGYAPFSSKFSPFFASTAYDQDVQGMTQIGLLTTDRVGAVIYNGINGEKVSYNGTEYEYKGPADLKVEKQADGKIFYDFTLRDDLKFSDGEKLTVDDVIFSMYVLADPTYDGSSTIYAAPIEGMDAYRSGVEILYNLMAKAGRDNTDFTNWTKEEQDKFWTEIDAAGIKFVTAIKDYCVANGYNKPEDPVEVWAKNWGFEVPAGSDEAALFAEMAKQYEYDYINLSSAEKVDTELFQFLESYDEFAKGIETGNSAPNITGIQKIDDTHLRVVLTEEDAPAIYQLGVSIAPMHYYGDKAKFDYANNKFGFDKGDLSTVRAKTTQPMGAGPYIFKEFKDGTVYFEANPNYFKGEPKIKNVNFKETNETDKLNGLKTGDIDVTDPSFNSDCAKNIGDMNGNGELTGDVITTSLVANLGYGYIGINADNVNVGGKENKGSEASKNFRKALGTLLSVYRDVAIDTYYGDRANVINYPISDTSWAAPQKTDAGYQVAFSKDVDGNEIYTSDMTTEQKYDAALKAALGYLEKAGFTVENGKVTKAPEGAKLEYEIIIPADGVGDHPSFQICTLTKDALAKIGINLIINDPADSNELWNKLDAGTAELWCAAWGATIDPDMTQIYFSDVKNNGANRGKDSVKYNIYDEKLDELIVAGRKSTDQAYRKTVYKEALDIIVDWACEIPIYQRQNAISWSTKAIKEGTMTPDITTFYGWMGDIENIEMN